MYDKRSLLILNYIKKNKIASRHAIQDSISKTFLSKNSKVTVLRDLNILLKNGKINKIGKGRNIAYSYALPSSLETINIRSYFKKDVEERALKSEYFNFEVWDSLNNLVSPKEKEEIKKINEIYINNKALLSTTAFKKELERLTIEFSWKSSKIEGNTYSLLDTEHLLKDNVEAKGKKREEAIMILNHKKAFDFIYSKTSYFKKMSLYKIEELHHLLVDNLNVSFGLRKNRVGITGTNYRPLDNVHQIRQAVEQLVNVINKVSNAFEKALITVLMISYIQPFEDGNKRSARTLGNALLLANNYCPLSYRSVDECEYKKAMILFYEQNNAAYFKKLFIEQFKQAVKKYF